MHAIEYKSLDALVAEQDAAADYMRVPLEIKSIDQAGAFVGYAAIFGEVDKLADVCHAGCFAESIAEWKARGTWPRLKWRHYQTVGHTTALAEDARGLRVDGVIWDAGVAAEVKDAVDNGPGVWMSFAFVALHADYEGEVRHLYRLSLMDDITITLKPVNTSTGIIQVKSGDGLDAVPTARRVEGVLRDAGLSRRTSKAIVAGGVSTLREARPGGVARGLADILETLNAI